MRIAFAYSDRISITSPSFAKTLYSSLEPYISTIPSFYQNRKPSPVPCGMNESIRLYRYSKGQYFGQHYDDSVSAKGPDGRRAWSEWTLLVYVTGKEDGVEGGEVQAHAVISRLAN